MFWVRVSFVNKICKCNILFILVIGNGHVFFQVFEF